MDKMNVSDDSVKFYTDHDAVEDAFDSDFVDNVMLPFKATSRADAERQAKEYFGAGG